MKRIINLNYGKKKDWRKQFRKSRRFDYSCRCGGSCSWCRSNRLHSLLVSEDKTEKEIIEYFNKDQI